MTHTFPISDSEESRRHARHAILSAPDGHVVTFQRKIVLNGETRNRALGVVHDLLGKWIMKVTKRNRTLEQNDKMWAMLTDLSRQKPEGRMCTPDDWKCLVMHACGHDVQFMIGLNGKPFPTGMKSSQLNIGEMSMLIEWMYAYGAEQGIVWSEPEPHPSNERNVA